MTKITLNASMRTNLLSLQRTSELQDVASLRLSTGLKVNSAIDNPSSYYTAQSLTCRAGDLEALLDAMGQGIQTIKTATTALESGAEFLEQAAATANSALETAEVPPKSWIEQQDGVAAVVTDWTSLKVALDSGKQGDIVIYGNIICEDSITLQAGQNLVGVGKYGATEPDVDKFSQLNFDLNTTSSNIAIQINGDVEISDLSIKNISRSTQASYVIHSSTANNTIQIKNLDLLMDNSSILNDSSYGISRCNVILDGINNVYNIAAETSSATCFGFSYTDLINKGILNINLNDKYSRGITGGSFVTESNSITNILSQDIGTSFCQSTFKDNSRINICTRNSAFAYGSADINDQAIVNIKSNNSAFFTDTDNPFTINLNSTSAQINFTGNNFIGNNAQNLTFNSVEGVRVSWNDREYILPEITGRNDLDDNSFKAAATTVRDTTTPEPDLDWLTAQNADRSMEYKEREVNGAQQYDDILRQYDTLINDSHYKGVNLLQEQNLKVNFNEDRSSFLDVKGYDASSQALGLSTKSWKTSDDILSAIGELTSALNSIRTISSELGASYAILNTRQEFTENLINVLEEGADKLTLADMNEEAAQELALQTRRQLATNSLSLAAQASQSVLMLF